MLALSSQGFIILIARSKTTELWACNLLFRLNVANIVYKNIQLNANFFCWVALPHCNVKSDFPPPLNVAG